jgi:hypothetical protein
LAYIESSNVVRGRIGLIDSGLQHYSSPVADEKERTHIVSTLYSNVPGIEAVIDRLPDQPFALNENDWRDRDDARTVLPAQVTNYEQVLRLHR